MNMIFGDRKSLRVVLFAATTLCLLLGSVLGYAEESTHAQASETKPTDPLLDFFSSQEEWEKLADPTQPLDKTLNRVHKLRHFVSYAPGEKIFVTEYFTLRSVLRQPARAVIFLTAAEYRGSFWDIPVSGYSAPAMAAERGFFAYTIDYIGMGGSHRPGGGSGLDFLRNAEAVSKLVDRVRRSRRVDKVDLVGEGFGGEVAAALADDSMRIRSVFLSSVWYKEFSEPFRAAFINPAFEAFLRSRPDGYWIPNFVARTLAWTDNQEIRDYVFSTQQDLEVPTGPFLQLFEPGLPIIDAVAARVPALIVSPEFNPFPAPGDMAKLATEWGGGASLVILQGSFHASRIEGPEIAGEYFQQLFNFIDAPF